MSSKKTKRARAVTIGSDTSPKTPRVPKKVKSTNVEVESEPESESEALDEQPRSLAAPAAPIHPMEVDEATMDGKKLKDAGIGKTGSKDEQIAEIATPLPSSKRNKGKTNRLSQHVPSRGDAQPETPRTKPTYAKVASPEYPKRQTDFKDLMIAERPKNKSARL